MTCRLPHEIAVAASGDEVASEVGEKRQMPVAVADHFVVRGGVFGAACMGLAAVAGEAVSLGISAVARALLAHAVRARVHAWIATVSAVDDGA